jgi:hypothetical protein
MITSRIVFGTICASVFLAGPTFADPLMGNAGWQPRQEASRASIAALMDSHAKADAAGGYAGTSFGCGGGGTATSTGNYTCIIINGSTAAIDTDQDSTGNQTSNTNTTATANGVTNESLSSILEGLN